MPRKLLPDGYKAVYDHQRRYTAPRGATGNADARINPLGGRTICTIYDADRNPIAAGEARCRSDEHYVKRIGRGFSFSRALDDLRENTPVDAAIVAERLAHADTLAAQIIADRHADRRPRSTHPTPHQPAPTPPGPRHPDLL